MLNRYRNALGFLDDEISNLIRRLDPERNVIVLTGDRGESFWDDGTFMHASRGSDVQMRVPLVVVGPGIPRGRLTARSRHMDVLPSLLHLLAGRNVPLAHTHGRDQFAQGFKDDRLVLYPFRGNQQAASLVLLRDEQRLRVRLFPERRSFVTEGFSDVNDRFDDTVIPQRPEVDQWQELLIEEWQRLCSSD